MTIKIEVNTTTSKKMLDKIKSVYHTETILKGLGEVYLSWVQKNFDDRGTEKKWKPLSSATLKRRGPSAVPLQDKGNLRRFNKWIIGNYVIVGPTVKYAKYHHYGTSRGLPARKLIPSNDLAQKIAAKYMRALAKRIG